MTPHFILITGTNGVGKSTFGHIFSRQENIPFIDIDLFYKQKFGVYREYTEDEIKETTQELSNLRQQYFENKQSFAQEMIIASAYKAERLVEQAKQHGFQTSLVYMGVDKADKEVIQTLKNRINDRITKGLHYVEPATISLNLADVITNFKKVVTFFDNIAIYNNSTFYNRILDIRNKEIYKAKTNLPQFAKELIQDTFIDNKLKMYQLQKETKYYIEHKNSFYGDAKKKSEDTILHLYKELSKNKNIELDGNILKVINTIIIERNGGRKI